MKSTITRRHFIQSAIAATGAAAHSTSSWGQAAITSSVSPNNQLNVACVGIANMGSMPLRASSAENLVAVCDVDWREDTKVWRKNSPAFNASQVPHAKKFSDFREMLDVMNDDIDVVCVSTPDHTHFPITLAAMEKGKHVFVQKPLSHNVWQVRTLRKAMHKYGVTTVMGNQGHTSDGIRSIKEWYDAGILGEVREVHCWTDRPRGPWFIKPETFPPAYPEVPDQLNWELWQGPVTEQPYSPEYVPVKWRAWWDYGVGCLGDIGCHCIDAPFYALNLGMPTAVDIELDQYFNDQFTPFGAHVTYHFPARGDKPPVTLHWYEGKFKPPMLDGLDELPSNGMYMIGSEETVYHEGMRPYEPMLWPKERNEVLKERLAQKTIPRVEGGPVEELFYSLKDGPTPGSNFDYAAQLTEVVLLGGIAIRTGKRIEWDAEKMEITNHPELNKYVKEPVRKGWEFGENLWT